MPVTTTRRRHILRRQCGRLRIDLDTSRHLNTILDIDPEARTARVEPGVVQSALQLAAAPHGLRFGPDPSTSNRCTIGGMIGNNACGPRALRYGKTADNVVALEAITGSGEQITLPSTAANHDHYVSLAALEVSGASQPGTIRTEFGRLRRQVSGYSLEHLLPEHGFNVGTVLAGTEGTLAVIIGATVRLVADAPYKIMLALGYPTMADAADAALSSLIIAQRPARAWIAGLSMWYAALAGMSGFRHCREETVGCSSSSSATTWPSCGYAVMRCWLRPERRTDSSSRIQPRRQRFEDPRGWCGPRDHQSGPTRLSRLGGCRGSRRAPGRIPARFRQIA